METKICSKCKNAFPKNRFNFHLKKQHKGVDYFGVCRICKNELNRKMYKNRNPRKDTQIRNKRMTLELDDFYITQLIFISLKRKVPRSEIMKDKELLQLYKFKLQIKRLRK